MLAPHVSLDLYSLINLPVHDVILFVKLVQLIIRLHARLELKVITLIQVFLNDVMQIVSHVQLPVQTIVLLVKLALILILQLSVLANLALLNVFLAQMAQLATLADWDSFTIQLI